MFVVGAVLIGIYVVLHTFAATDSVLYVDGDSKGGACLDSRSAAQTTLATPLCSISRALDLAGAGTTIYVRQASYPRAVFTKTNTTDTTVKAYQGEQPIIKGLEFTEGKASHYRVEGFKISDWNNVQGTYIQLVNSELADTTNLNGSNNTVEGNYIHDLDRTMDFNPDPTLTRCNSFVDTDADPEPVEAAAPHCGSAFRTGGLNNTIRNNKFLNIAADSIQSFYSTNLLIEGNDIGYTAAFKDKDEHSDGTQLIGSNQNVIIRNNYYHENRGILPMTYRDGSCPTNLTIENNVFYNERERGVGATCVDGMKIINNTGWGNGATGVDIKSSAVKNAVLRNNIFEAVRLSGGGVFQDEYNYVKFPVGYTPSASSTYSDPKFVANDTKFHLALGSPAIDSGTSEDAPALDYEGRARFDVPSIANTGGGSITYYDRGANEYGGTIPASTAPTVALTSPVVNASYTAPAAITLNAAASDSGGSISKVEFYIGGTKLGEDTTAPYAFTWSSVSAGSYSLTAVATNNTGTKVTSSAVPVTVVNPYPDTTITASPATVAAATNATFSFAASQASPTFECRLDAAAFAACTSPTAYTQLQNGAHSFSVRATTTAGTDPTPATFSWSVGGSQTPSTPRNVADINDDDTVDILDFSYMLSKYSSNDASSDINHDGIVDILDFSLLLNNYGK